MRRRRAALGLLASLAVAGCAAAPEAPPPAATAPPREPSFQAHLDRLGVDLTLPPAGKAIVVNIPAFRLVAFEDATPVLTSRVIVGTPWNRTPRLETHTTTVRFRPTWRPTPSMIASGEVEAGVRPPGRDNPLGLAAIRLEEGLLVYLHDTNRRDLFAEAERALSHGCIRVERWDALVAWLLERDLAWVHAMAEGDRTVDVPAPEVPVILGYFPVFPDATGRAVRHDDVYDLVDAPPEDADRAMRTAPCPGAFADG